MKTFPGEGYSRKMYDEWQKKAEKEPRPPTTLQLLLEDTIFQLERNARRTVERLYAASESEARLLNERYDHLLRRAQKALQDVHEFERDKLEMHEPERKEKKKTT